MDLCGQRNLRGPTEGDVQIFRRRQGGHGPQDTATLTVRNPPQAFPISRRTTLGVRRIADEKKAGAIAPALSLGRKRPENGLAENRGTPFELVLPIRNGCGAAPA
ncbi:hypothetical protein FH063_005794 [Azospirillum argentinense]|uniref:Uncharacterized protein n=1 Tax=Azospirillum argentinense TaxID=2970906 RepID=A0A5B0KRC4_9PROT|nr:hypothetical protein FH063_005794 [Azospirillum argentinense]